MADEIKKQTITGRQIVRNIPTQIVDAIKGVTQKGLITQATRTDNGEQVTETGEDGIICTVISENYTMGIDIQMIMESGTVIPKMGDLIATDLFSELGVLPQGAIIVEPGGSTTYDRSDNAQISFSAVWYPWVDVTAAPLMAPLTAQASSSSSPKSASAGK